MYSACMNGKGWGESLIHMMSEYNLHLCLESGKDIEILEEIYGEDKVKTISSVM